LKSPNAFSTTVHEPRGTEGKQVKLRLLNLSKENSGDPPPITSSMPDSGLAKASLPAQLSSDSPPKSSVSPDGSSICEPVGSETATLIQENDQKDIQKGDNTPLVLSIADISSEPLARDDSASQSISDVTNNEQLSKPVSKEEDGCDALASEPLMEDSHAMVGLSRFNAAIIYNLPRYYSAAWPIEDDLDELKRYLYEEATLAELAHHFSVDSELFYEYESIDGESLLELALRMNCVQQVGLLIRVCPYLLGRIDHRQRSILQFLTSVTRPERLVRVIVDQIRGEQFQLKRVVRSSTDLPRDCPPRHLISLLIHDILYNSGKGIDLLRGEGYREINIYRSICRSIVEEYITLWHYPESGAIGKVNAFLGKILSGMW
jgi:hypothetical protein